MGFIVINMVASILAKIGAVVAPIFGLICGILMLVPAKPFDHRNVTFGVVLVVLSLMAVMSLIGYVLGFCLGYVICGIAALVYYIVLGIVALMVMGYEGMVSCCCNLDTSCRTKDVADFTEVA